MNAELQPQVKSTKIDTQLSRQIAAGRQMVKKKLSCQIAADQLERCLQLGSSDLHLQLLYVVDVGLLESEPLLHERARSLVETGSYLDDRIFKAFPTCSSNASHLVRQKGLSLAKEVEFYRQEQFWQQSGRDSLLVCEDIIRDLYRLYRDVVLLIQQIDSVDTDSGIHNRTFPDLRRSANPYADVIGD